MAELVAKHVAKNFIKDHRPNKRGTNDLYFEEVPVIDRHGRQTKKTTKRWRQPPPGLTKKEEKVLTKVMKRSYRLDNAMNICGTRVGYSAIVGLIPVIGDFFDTILALFVLQSCKSVDLPASVASRMLVNIAIDFIIGLTPLLGDIGDALWRCNTMNAALLYNTLEARGAKRIREGGSGTNEKRSRSRPGRAGTGIAPQGAGVISQQPQMSEISPIRRHEDTEITRPEPTRAKSGGFLNRFNPLKPSDQEVTDLENAEGGHTDDRGRTKKSSRR